MKKGKPPKRNGNTRVRFLHNRWQVLFFALGASLLSLATYWYQQNYHPVLLESLDQRSRDVVFRLRPAPEPPPEIAVVAIDERSVKDYGRWPWPRHLQGELIAKLKAQGAGTVALDIVFAQPYSDREVGAREDAALIRALQQPGAPVVGGYFFRGHKSRLTDGQALEQLFDNRIKRKLLRPGGRVDTVPVYEFAETNQAHIAQHMAGLGAFNRDTDLDGLVRRAPLIFSYRDELFPSLSLRALAAYAGWGEGIVAAPEGITEVKLGDFSIPVDQNGRITANFYDQQTGIPIYSAADILNDVVGPQQLQGRLIFLGVTEIGIADLIPTPVNDILPGVMMHATVAANILQENHLFRNLDTVIIDIALIALIPLIGVLIMARLGKLSQMVLVSLLFAAVLGALFYWLVAEKRQLVSLFYPAAAMMTAFVAFGIYYVMTSQRTTRFLTGAFSSYVSPELVDQLMNSPESLGLSGDKREVTILFADIRSFTTISEQLPPERLVQLLNRYFDEMTDTILERKGTLDKYIGDAIMAIFNAPLEIRNHQRQAARSALAMIDRLQATQPEFSAKYNVDLNIGIGLHCGEAVVGNLGSSQRFDYTAIGDSVNLASRIESICKYYRVPIIITDDVQRHLNDDFLTRPLDRIQVKGKTVPTDIYELMPFRDENERLALQFKEVFNAYLKREFAAALTLLERLRQHYPDDWPVQLYLDRCQTYRDQMPPADWDGVYHAKSK